MLLSEAKDETRGGVCHPQHRCCSLKPRIHKNEWRHLPPSTLMLPPSLLSESEDMNEQRCLSPSKWMLLSEAEDETASPRQFCVGESHVPAVAVSSINNSIDKE